MKYKVGDRVKVREDLRVNEPTSKVLIHEDMAELAGQEVIISEVCEGIERYIINDSYWFWTDEMFEPIEDPLVKKIEERNHKPNILEGKDMNQPIDDPIEPQHYRNGDKDLFDELYDRLYHSKKMFTGREVFIIVMKFVAERYTRRYPNKNPEDLGKGIYTLERLKEYEVQNGKD